MEKEEIYKIIVNKKNTQELLTEEETIFASIHFTDEELRCMVSPLFDHLRCFCQKPRSSINVTKDTVFEPDAIYDFLNEPSIVNESLV